MSENSNALKPTSDWPTHGWKMSNPGDQKVNADQLRMAEREIEWAAFDVFSFLVVRYGLIVFEKYFQGYTATSPMEVQSITKSFIATLIGITLTKKMLVSLDQSVLSLFPEIVIP